MMQWRLKIVMLMMMASYRGSPAAGIGACFDGGLGRWHRPARTGNECSRCTSGVWLSYHDACVDRVAAAQGERGLPRSLGYGHRQRSDRANSRVGGIAL